MDVGGGGVNLAVFTETCMCVCKGECAIIYLSYLSSSLTHINTHTHQQQGFAARNVIDGLVETIAAEKGRPMVLESGMTFVRIAEAVDTPEMHAAITQAFKLGQKGREEGEIHTHKHMHTKRLKVARDRQKPKDLIVNMNDNTHVHTYTHTHTHTKQASTCSPPTKPRTS